MIFKLRNMKLLYFLILLTLLEQAINGSPLQMIFSQVDKICSSVLAGSGTKPPKSADKNTMTVALYTPCNRIDVFLSNIDEILGSPDFDANKRMAMFVSGWNAAPNSGDDISEAFKSRKDYNFLVLNTTDLLRGSYIPAAVNTQEVGRQVALSLEKVVKKIPAKNIHLVGHSLGAHVMGYAGQYFTERTGTKIGRITGLDPANPCFNKPQVLPGLRPGNAEFVDVIHSDPGNLGKASPTGDVDFYPGGLNPGQSGCPGCAHGRAVDYFVETVYPGNDQNFLGVPCATFNKLKEHSCSGTDVTMGLAARANLRGIYYLTVNANKPFGKNHKNNGQTECGKC